MKNRNLHIRHLVISLFGIGCISLLVSAIIPLKEDPIGVEKYSKINELITTYSEYGDFNGAILVADEGEIIYQQGFGYANMEWGIPNQSNTKFRIGSITKQFTAMLVVQLASENKIDLHVPISTYLPEYPKENADKITIHHLLTHTSGIPNNYDTPNEKPLRPDNYSPSDLVKRFSDLPLEFTPGEKFSYCNAGYSLLGLIVEKITKKTYEQVLQERIFEPLKMKNTGFDKHRALIENRASGYFKNWGEYFNSNYIDMSNAYAAGAIYSTVEDLYLWNKSFYTNQLVSEDYKAMIFDKHAEDRDYKGHYGYGWSNVEKPIGSSKKTVQSLGHDGTIDGFCAINTWIPSRNISIVLLSNIRRAPLNAMTKGIMGILYDEDYDQPKKSLAYDLLIKIDENGIKSGVEFYNKSKENEIYYINEDEINIVSYKLLQSDRAEAASEVLKLGIATYPNAFNLYDSHGEVLRALGKKTAAIENYEKSIALNPSNENGIKMLRELGVEVDTLKNNKGD